MSGCRKDCEVKKENAGLRSLLDFEIQKREVQSDYSFLASNYTVQKYYTDKEYERLKEENQKLKKTIEKIKALNLFSLNNSREKIAEINAIINDQKESEER